jgi:16S rRNA (guanine527-N7)-methyltransferase
LEEFKALLAREFAPFGALSESQLRLLERHYELLLRWNRKLNLTRITNLLEAVRLHYCESLYLAEFLPKSPLKIIDVGSGGGFPGIPVGIYRPDCSVDLVESHQRKAVFLTEIVRQLGLANVNVVAKRAQDITVPCDWAVSRAVNPDEVLALRVAPNVAILGNAGQRLPWGENRALFHVEHRD